ncbi:MAG: tRNA 2-thiouridine(34) synthase MnmA [Dehalococcoidia bacterium]|nr:tRNA 2-thiouridine(34) synthase MnmA [Dehalococcoidia bacterium]
MGSKGKPKVIIGMSGGIDSSVAAALLVNQGYRVTGVTMKTWNEGSPVCRGSCFSPGQQDGIENARRVAVKLGVPFKVIDLADEFREHVLNYFCSEYLLGKTPNPCVRCNRLIKFDLLWRKALDCGIEADFFATGHYARVSKGYGGRHLLKKGRDVKKDQSYFLYGLSQRQLARTMFPLGDYLKQDVRTICAEMQLDIETGKESQDFAGGDYSPLFEGKCTPGPIVDRQGNVLGRHRGIVYFTPGQRRGLGIASREPLYVVDVRAETNTVVVGSLEELQTEEQIVSDANWIARESPAEDMRVIVRIRSSHAGYEAVISQLDDGKLVVRYKKPQVGAARGQSIVFYDGDVVLGGGIAQ